MGMRFLGFLKATHIAKLSTFRHKCTQWCVNSSIWDYRLERITMKAILKHLELPKMEQIITVRILRFLEKVALIPGGRLTREVLRSQAKPVAQSKRGAKEMSSRQSYVHALKAAALLDSNDGAFSKWMHRFGERDIGSHIDKQL
jgi:hypothetical protein